MRMNSMKGGLGLAIVAALVVGMGAATVQAEQSQSWLDRVLEADDVQQQALGVPTLDQVRRVVTLGASYTFVTDHVWRGIRMSDYPGEGAEKPNHQMEVTASLGLSELIGLQDAGNLNFGFWFSWYVHNKRMGESSYLQQVDYTVSYSNALPAGWMDYELGYTARQFNAPVFPNCTHEIWGRVGFDDSWLWRQAGLAVDRPILNPYLYWGFDVDAADWGSYGEFGISHNFVLADYGLANIPVLADLTVTPSWAIALNHRYYDGFIPVRPVTNFAFMRYGLAVGYDLTSGLNLPREFGTFSVNGFLEFSQRLGLKALDDKLYGGFTVAWQW